MPTSIAEYAGMAWLRSGASQFPAPQEPAISVTIISSAASSGTNSTIQFSSNTRLVAISGQAGFYALFGTSLFSTVASTVSGQGSTALSSTSAQYFVGNFTHFRGVLPSSKLLGFTS